MLHARQVKYPFGRERPITIILLGPPGAGKGTQCDLLSNALRIPAISSGDLLRANIRAGTAIGKRANEIMKEGALVQNELICEMISDRVKAEDCSFGYILDGIPRTEAQAKFVESLSPKSNLGETISPVILRLELDDETILRRLSGRRICPMCSLSYNIETNPPKVEGLCDKDGLSLETREDDRQEVCRRRLDAYHRTIEAIIGFYQKRHRVEVINANRPAKELARDLIETIWATMQNRPCLV